MRSLEEVRDEAVLGSYCPKMCNFSCPVTAATGRETVTPWGLHVTVAAVAEGRRTPDATSFAALTGCTGCHACREACLYDLDVPAQVRAARAVHDRSAHPALERAGSAAAEGRSPYGVDLPDPDRPPEADVQVVVGCRDEPGIADAVVRLLAAASTRARVVVPAGCCGALLADLGLVAEADRRAAALTARLDRSLPAVCTDPHCLPTVREAVDAPVEGSVSVLGRLVDDGALDLAGGADGGGPATVAYHDPCLLARDEGCVDPPRRLLDAAGLRLVEPLGHGLATACSGAGMGMDLVDPEAAAAVAARRAEQLRRTDAPVVATACSRARAGLRAAGSPAEDLHVLLARRLDGAAGGGAR